MAGVVITNNTIKTNGYFELVSDPTYSALFVSFVSMQDRCLMVDHRTCRAGAAKI